MRLSVRGGLALHLVVPEWLLEGRTGQGLLQGLIGRRALDAALLTSCGSSISFCIDGFLECLVVV